jgi:hypothetical protein
VCWGTLHAPGRARSSWWPSAPLQPEVEALRQNLVADPGLQVAIAYYLPESAVLLEPLVAEFGERVRMVPIDPP